MKFELAPQVIGGLSSGPVFGGAVTRRPGDERLVRLAVKPERAADPPAVSFTVRCPRLGSCGVTDRIWAAVLPGALPILSNSGTTAESQAAAAPHHDRAYRCERHLGW